MTRDGTAGSAGSTLVRSETSVLSPDETESVARLAAAAAAVDGIGPLDDQVRSEVKYGASEGSHHILGRPAGQTAVAGYAHIHVGVDGASAHLVVDPEHRRRGYGLSLLDHLRGLVDGAGGSSAYLLRVWAHGDTAGAQSLARRRGFARVRDLWQMRRDLAPPLPAASYPADVVVRTFDPGRDDTAWVALNAAAFASHPEQGRLTVADLGHRIAEPWFDPSGFFLAERAGALLGSHWTKVHAAGARGPGSERIGEVYAVGVHPAAQGLGLGKALTLTGLTHLRDVGLGEVMLYVDGDNTAAIGLYQRLGFETTKVDAMYAVRT